MVDVELLVGSAEIAERLGVTSHTAVHRWRLRDPTFPQPVATVTRTLIWLWPEVEKWAKRTGRLPYRPNP